VKILSICQPWAHAIVFMTKRIENRSWSTPYRGPLLIHADVLAELADGPLGDPPGSQQKENA